MKRIVLSSFVMLFVVVLAATAALAADPAASCQSRKLKAWAKLRSCEHKASAKLALGGTVDPTACRTKFDTAMTKVGTGCRYLDNRDGTVTDLDTGLMWRKTDDNGGLTDKDNVYTWSATGTAPDGTVFTEFLAGLNTCTSPDGASISGGLAGHCDWRLPQIDELQSILLEPYLCSSNPCIDQIAFGPTNASSPYWSAARDEFNPGAAWLVDLELGFVPLNGKNLAHQARAVRSGL